MNKRLIEDLIICRAFVGYDVSSDTGNNENPTIFKNALVRISPKRFWNFSVLGLGNSL